MYYIYLYMIDLLYLPVHDLCEYCWAFVIINVSNLPVHDKYVTNDNAVR